MAEVRWLAERLKERGWGIALAIAKLSDDLPRDLDDLCAMVTIFWQFYVITEFLQIPHAHGLGQVCHLVAGIIEIIFADDLCTGPIEQIRNGLTNAHLPSVSRMKIPSGICA